MGFVTWLTTIELELIRTGVAIRCGPGDESRPDAAGCARAVLDDHRLSQQAVHLLAQEARYHVNPTAGRKPTMTRTGWDG